MISPTALLWVRIGAGLLPILIAAQAGQVWHRRSAMQVAVLVVLGLGEAALLPLALTGEIAETAHNLPLGLFLVPVACIVLGAAAVVRFLENRRHVWASAHWPTVRGTITQSELAVVLDDEGDETYRADVRFAYQVNDREFEGSNVQWNSTPSYAWRSRAAAALEDYPLGKAVTVHYDPAQPTLAVLEPLDRAGMAMPLVLAVASGGIGLFVLKLLSSAA